MLIKLSRGFCRGFNLAAPLLLFLLLPTQNALAQEAITISPNQGPAGTTVTVNGTGFAPGGQLLLSFLNFSANPDVTTQADANGAFTATVTVPQEAPEGETQVVVGDDFASAIAGAPFTVATTEQSQLPPAIMNVETFREGDLVFFRLFYTDPNGDAEGFGFRGANGAGWGEETHPFSSPSFGRVSPGIVEYPFNHACDTGPAYESDVEAWIYDSAGLQSSPITVHLACNQVPLSPGWYSSEASDKSSIIYKDNTGLIIQWKNSYIYNSPGNINLYWYAEVVYLNKGGNSLLINCGGRTSPSLASENMRGTSNVGVVLAEETFCSRNPSFTEYLHPGGAHYEWAIFHNVPQGGEVSLGWGPYGSSQWVNPWYKPYPSNTLPPAECPGELVTLRTCNPPVPQNEIKQLIDMTSGLVSGINLVCKFIQCSANIKFPADFLHKVFNVFRISVLQVQTANFGNKLTAFNQTVNTYGGGSPQVCQAAKELAQSILDLREAVLNLFPRFISEQVFQAFIIDPSQRPKCKAS